MASTPNVVDRMYGPTVTFDAAMFIGLEIDSITYAENAMHLSLSNGFAITSMTGIRYRGTELGKPREDRLPVSESSLMGSVGTAVAAAARTASGGLVLTLRNGAVIEFEDDSDQYESYSITTPDGEIFI
jgi:hypothetical protein